MTSPESDLEREALNEFARRLSGQGYKVVREPSRAELPDFLGSFQPDAIAIGKRPSLLIEVITRRGSGVADVAKVEQLRSLIDGHPDWKLEVVYTAASTPLPSVASVDAIRRRYEDVERLSVTDRPAALIMAWSLLEAVTRAIVPDLTKRGLSPASIVELLASHGYIAQSKADVLQHAGRLRNLIVHGDVTIDVPSVELENVFDIVVGLIKRIEQKLN
jgi:uncharacterized protein YutE (UPF0331/DUF86 family)